MGFNSMKATEIIVTHMPTDISVKTVCYRDIEAAHRLCLKVIRAKIAARNEKPLHNLRIEHGNGDDMQLFIDLMKENWLL